jgi:hypothetical protein
MDGISWPSGRETVAIIRQKGPISLMFMQLILAQEQAGDRITAQTGGSGKNSVQPAW